VSGGEAAPARVDSRPAGELGLWEAVDAYHSAVGTATVAELAGGGGAAFHLHLAALEAVIEHRMGVHAVISIHRALLAGAPVTQIAQATGLSREQIAERWAVWAGGQVRLGERTGIGMTRQEYERAAAAISACSGALPGSAVPAGLHVLPDKHR
jgi:hypothetical protein